MVPKERVLLDEKTPPGPCTFVDRPEPCSFLPLDLGYTLYFGNPLFPTKAESKDKSLGHSSLSLFCRVVVVI